MPCCDLHNQHCEPPADLCCARCTEASHPVHGRGETCVLAAVSLPPTPRSTHDQEDTVTTDALTCDPCHGGRCYDCRGYCQHDCVSDEYDPADDDQPTVTVQPSEAYL